MDLQITGTVTRILPEVSGEGKNGPWRKQEFVLETGGQYPKQVCMYMWGDSIEQFGIREGETLTAHIDLSSREYNGRWYTDVKAWRVERPQGQAGAPAPGDDEPWPEPAGDGEDPFAVKDDLPF